MGIDLAWQDLSWHSVEGREIWPMPARPGPSHPRLKSLPLRRDPRGFGGQTERSQLLSQLSLVPW